MNVTCAPRSLLESTVVRSDNTCSAAARTDLSNLRDLLKPDIIVGLVVM